MRASATKRKAQKAKRKTGDASFSREIVYFKLLLYLLRLALYALNVRIPLFIIAILGLLVSGYLFITYTTGGPILCGAGHGCDTVRASEYAYLFGLPTPLYGLVYYLLLAVGALMATAEHARWLKLPLALLTGVGLVVSVGLTYIEAFVIDAWCLWCVVSAILATLAFFLVWAKLPTYGDRN